MELSLYTSDGTTFVKKAYDIPQFDDSKGTATLRQVLLAYMANKRLGTHSTLNHATVHGTGKKPFRQKGTGRARQGSMIGNQHYHGGTWKGPRPRDYSQKINKKMRTLALKRAIYNRALAGEIDVIENFATEEPKTKLFVNILNRINISKNLLIVDHNWDSNVIMAARNINRITISTATDLNALDLTKYKRILLSEKGLNTLLGRVKGDL